MANLMRLAERLFGAEEDPDPSPGWKWLARYLVLVGVLALLVFFRRPDAILNSQFWAEDGNIYFYEQLTLGFWPALHKLWMGFPYLIQRIISALAGGLPIAAAPLAYNGSAIAITALSMATFSLPGFRHLVRSDALRATFCVATVCIPTGSELLATSTCLGWFLAPWLVFLSVMRTPRSRAIVAGCCLGGALAVFSTPLAPIVAPLWALRAVYGARERREKDLVFALTQLLSLLGLVATTGLLGAGDVTLAGGSLAKEMRLEHLWSSLGTLPYVAAWCINTALLPMRAVGQLASAGTLQFLGPALAVVAAIGLAFRDLSGRGRATLGLAIYLFASSLCVTLAGRHNVVRGFQGSMQNVNVEAILFPRYRVMPYVALLLAAAAVIDCGRHTRTRLVAALVACAALGVWASEFRLPPFPDNQWPLWAAKLQRKLDHGTGEPLIIPLNPPGYRMVFDSGDTQRAPAEASHPQLPEAR